MPTALNLRSRFQLPTGPLESIPISGRSYVKGFREYDAAAAAIRNFAQPLSICRPIVTFLDQVDYSALDARRQLIQALASERFHDLDERMRLEGVSLENFLQRGPEIDLASLDDQLKLTEELEEFFDRFIEATMKPAFDLASYLIGSKF